MFPFLAQPSADKDIGADAAGATEGASGDKAASPSSRRFQQEFHVLACRVSASGEHVWSLVVENNGQVHTQCPFFFFFFTKHALSAVRSTGFRRDSSLQAVCGAVGHGRVTGCVCL